MGAIIGVDLSLRSTGVAILSDSDGELTWLVKSSGHRGDSLALRADRVKAIADRVVELACVEVALGGAVDLIVVEAPSYNTAGGSTHDRSGLWWIVVAALREIAPVATVPPSSRAKYATGNGHATKGAVVRAMTKIFPAWLGNDDEADALALACMGARWLGRPLELSLSTDQRDAYSSKGIEWPVTEGALL